MRPRRRPDRPGCGRGHSNWSSPPGIRAVSGPETVTLAILPASTRFTPACEPTSLESRTLRVGVRSGCVCLNCAVLWLLPMGVLLGGGLAGGAAGCAGAGRGLFPGCGAGACIGQVMSGSRRGGVCDQ
jgi:hypothetical protein